MDAQSWIAEFAAAADVAAPSEADVERILGLAAAAAHSSERIAAPVACWIAAGAGVGLERALEPAEGIAPADAE